MILCLTLLCIYVAPSVLHCIFLKQCLATVSRILSLPKLFLHCSFLKLLPWYLFQFWHILVISCWEIFSCFIFVPVGIFFLLLLSVVMSCLSGNLVQCGLDTLAFGLCCGVCKASRVKVQCSSLLMGAPK